jgi:hypothetical protein
MALATLTIDINAKLANIEQDLGKVSHLAEKSAARMDAAFGAAKAAFAGMAAAFSVGALIDNIKGIIDLGDEMNDLSQRVGISVKDLATWKLAAEQSGTSLESLAKGVKGLSTFMVDHSDKLKKAGITATDANGALIQLADLFANMPDGVTKTALAVKLFGKAGMDMIPMLNQGSKGLSEAQEKAKVYGERMAALAPQADKFNDQLSELALHSKVASMAMVSSMLPAMTEISAAMAIAAQEGGALKAIWIGFGGIGAQVLNPLSALIKQVGASAHEFAADFNESMAKITTGNVSQNFYKTALEERAQAQRIYREMAALGDGLGLEGPEQKRPETAAEIVARIKREQEATRKAMGLAKEGHEKKAAKFHGVDDYASRINQAVAGAINSSAVVKSRELADQIEALDKLFFDSGLDMDIYTSAMAKLTGQTDKASKETDRLMQLLAATPTAKLEETRKDMELLASMLEGGHISENQFIEAAQARLGTLGEAVKEVDTFAHDMGMGFNSAFEEAAIGGKSLSDVLKGLDKDIARIILRKSVTEPIGKAVSKSFDGFSSGGFGMDSLTDFFIPKFSFASGTDYVPRDMIAQIHKGERIVPAGENRARGFGGDSVTIDMPVTIDARGADASVIPQINAALAALEQRIYRNVPGITARQQMRNRITPMSA